MEIKTKTIISLGYLLLALSGCNSSQMPQAQAQGRFYYEKIYFGKNFSLNYQKGIIDGCTTSKGYYTKSHSLFNSNNDYNRGWFLGRKRCKRLLKLNERGDIVS